MRSKCGPGDCSPFSITWNNLIYLSVVLDPLKSSTNTWPELKRLIELYLMMARTQPRDFYCPAPSFPRERERIPDACAYVRLTQILPSELPPSALRKGVPRWHTRPRGCENPLRGDWVPRKVQQIPDYFTPEEAAALVEGAPSYPTRMAFRLMLKTGLRVSEALALRRVDLRLGQDPPIIVVRADSPGNKAKKGREVPVPADLVESLHDLASFHNKDRQRPMLDISRWRLSQVMKETALEVGIDPARAHPHAFRHTYGRNCVLRGIPIPVLQKWLGHQSLKDTQRYVELAGAHHEWVSRL